MRKWEVIFARNWTILRRINKQPTDEPLNYYLSLLADSGNHTGLKSTVVYALTATSAVEQAKLFMYENNHTKADTTFIIRELQQP